MLLPPGAPPHQGSGGGCRLRPTLGTRPDSVEAVGWPSGNGSCPLVVVESIPRANLTAHGVLRTRPGRTVAPLVAFVATTRP